MEEDLVRAEKVQKSISGRISRDAYVKESRLYFESIEQAPILFIEARKVVKPYIYLDVRNAIALFIIETFQLDKWVELRIVLTDQSELDTNSLQSDSLLRLKCCQVFENSTKNLGLVDDKCNDNSSEPGGTRKHPSVSVTGKRLIICGLSSVIRFVFKYISSRLERNTNVSDSNLDLLQKLNQFLGFRFGCLHACAETSVWTKFCEIDMISAVNEISAVLKTTYDNQVPLNSSVVQEAKIPDSLMQFEHHLTLPLKIHNYRKVVQDNRRKQKEECADTDTLCDNLKNISVRDLKHVYAEGATLLLSDLILYPSVHACVMALERSTFQDLFPVTLKWYDTVTGNLHNKPDIDLICNLSEKYVSINTEWICPQVPVQTLYTKDPSRLKSTMKQLTRQYEIDEALEFLKLNNVMPLEIHEIDPQFKWSDIPILAHPEGGSLPISRQSRKCEQLASMAYYALKVYSKKRPSCSSSKPYRVVDFCSGGGHLGILVAWLLPECQVILVENKDESLRRAQQRVQGLGLSNVFFYQSNLDYFESKFDLGLALHACGTATDLVLRKCVKANASFVCCPCCYGAMQENHVLDYPRSQVFTDIKIPLRQYFVLCHSSDQTHDEANEKTNQGKQCMALVDTDRCLYAKDYAYDVQLCKIVPETASPKNHILVGVSSDTKIL